MKIEIDDKELLKEIKEAIISSLAGASISYRGKVLLSFHTVRDMLKEEVRKIIKEDEEIQKALEEAVKKAVNDKETINKIVEEVLKERMKERLDDLMW